MPCTVLDILRSSPLVESKSPPVHCVVSQTATPSHCLCNAHRLGLHLIHKGPSTHHAALEPREPLEPKRALMVRTSASPSTPALRVHKARMQLPLHLGPSTAPCDGRVIIWTTHCTPQTHGRATPGALAPPLPCITRTGGTSPRFGYTNPPPPCPPGPLSYQGSMATGHT